MKICRLGFRLLAPLLLFALTGCSALAGSATAQADKLVPLDPRAWPTQARPSPTPRPTPFPRLTLATAPAPETMPQAGAGPLAVAARPAATVQANDSQAAVVGGQVNKNAVNLRAGPGTEYAIVGGLAAGANFRVQATNAARDWLLVVGGDKQGWLKAGLVTVNGDAAGLPQATPMPAPARPAPARTPTPTAAG